MNKETGWYNGDQKPVRVGVYKRSFRPQDDYFYSWWNGVTWGIDCHLNENASVNRDWTSYFQNMPWCGLTKESK